MLLSRPSPLHPMEGIKPPLFWLMGARSEDSYTLSGVDIDAAKDRSGNDRNLLGGYFGVPSDIPRYTGSINGLTTPFLPERGKLESDGWLLPIGSYTIMVVAEGVAGESASLVSQGVDRDNMLFQLYYQEEGPGNRRLALHDGFLFAPSNSKFWATYHVPALDPGKPFVAAVTLPQNEVPQFYVNGVNEAGISTDLYTGSSALGSFSLGYAPIFVAGDVILGDALIFPGVLDHHEIARCSQYLLNIYKITI